MCYLEAIGAEIQLADSKKVQKYKKELDFIGKVEEIAVQARVKM